MGYSDVVHTYQNLKATPEPMTEIATAAEDHSTTSPASVGRSLVRSRPPATFARWPCGSAIPMCARPRSLLECAIARRLDAGDQPHQAIVAVLWPGAVQQPGLNDAFLGQTPHSAPQPFHRPVAACLWLRTCTTSPHRWPGRIRRTVGSQVSNRARTPSRCAASRPARSLRMA
jgi:hypothetical protein